MLRIPIVRGRNFTRSETRTGAPVAIMTESTARLFWPNQDPIGKIVRLEGGTDIEVIGVAKDAQASHLARTDETYALPARGPSGTNALELLVHSAAGFGLRRRRHSSSRPRA